MSDSSWPNGSSQTEWKYIRADAWPGSNGNRSAYCLIRVLQLVVVLGFGLHGTARPAEYPSFTDVTETSGIARLVNDHYASNPTWWLSGLHLVDLDADGHLDLFLSAHGKGDTLAALNDGFGHFTLAAGTYPTSEIHLCYDSDEDGKVDLTMTYQDGGGQWWRN